MKYVNRKLSLLTLSLLTCSPAAFAIGYGQDVSGAVSDQLYYSLGGGSVISQPGTRLHMQKIGMDLGWHSDLICGNFDISTTIGNQLNGLTSGYQNLMSEVIQAATAAVASLPAMIIQRSNPGLYNLLSNGVLQGNVAFDKAQLNCQNMARKMADYSSPSKWTQASVTQEYKALTQSGDKDAVRLNESGNKNTGKTGTTWIGGQKRGGKNQPAIKPTHDLTAAGFNMMTNQPVLSTGSVSESQCQGRVCQKFRNSRQAAEEVVRVLGETSIRTCQKGNDCTSGEDEDQPGTSRAGTGFAPMLEETTKTNTALLVKLVNGSEKPTPANLSRLKTGSLTVTPSVIKALQRDPDNSALTARLAAELAMADTIETALLMRRMLITGLSEPNAAAQPEAREEGEKRIEVLDREIAMLKQEMEIRQLLARNAVLTILERETYRQATHPQQQLPDNTDSLFQQLENPQTK